MTDAHIMARALTRLGLMTAALAVSFGYVIAWAWTLALAARVGPEALVLTWLLFLSGGLLAAGEVLKVVATNGGGR